MSADEPTQGVYFIQAVGRPDDPIKIGYSDNVEARLRAHQGSSPYPLQVLGVLRGASTAVETRLHQRFAEHRIGGEWFAPTELLRRLIAGDEPMLTALVTREGCAQMLRLPREVIDDIADVAYAEHGPNGGARYWYEDVQRLAAAVESERIERATRRAVKLLRRRVVAAIDHMLTRERVAEAVAEAIAADVASSGEPRMIYGGRVEAMTSSDGVNVEASET